MQLYLQIISCQNSIKIALGKFVEILSIKGGLLRQIRSIHLRAFEMKIHLGKRYLNIVFIECIVDKYQKV